MSTWIECAAFGVIAGALVFPAGADILAAGLLWLGFTLGRHADSLRAAYNAYRLTWKG